MSNFNDTNIGSGLSPSTLVGIHPSSACPGFTTLWGVLLSKWPCVPGAESACSVGVLPALHLRVYMASPMARSNSDSIARHGMPNPCGPIARRGLSLRCTSKIFHPKGLSAASSLSPISRTKGRWVSVGHSLPPPRYDVPHRRSLQSQDEMEGGLLLDIVVL